MKGPLHNAAAPSFIIPTLDRRCLLYASKYHRRSSIYSDAAVQLCPSYCVNQKETANRQSLFMSNAIYYGRIIRNYTPICAATSAAKSSTFFSIPSPVSKRMNFLTVILAPFSLATCSTYLATDCFPSSALT